MDKNIQYNSLSNVLQNIIDEYYLLIPEDTTITPSIAAMFMIIAKLEFIYTELGNFNRGE